MPSKQRVEVVHVMEREEADYGVVPASQRRIRIRDVRDVERNLVTPAVEFPQAVEKDGREVQAFGRSPLSASGIV